MGAGFGTECHRPRLLSSASPVNLNIYDVGSLGASTALNNVLRPMGTGAFHCGVEVQGREWSYGFLEQGTGVFWCPPQNCQHHIFRETVSMGFCKMSEKQVDELLRVLMAEWRGYDYDVLSHNCCHFSDAMCRWLGVGEIPAWLTNLAGNAAAAIDGAQYARDRGNSLMDKLAKRYIGALCSNDVLGSLEQKRSNIVVAGKEARGADANDDYRFGDFTRGVARKLSGDAEMLQAADAHGRSAGEVSKKGPPRMVRYDF
eukprot:TRINITY_DN42894_c0_g1_i1.p1 TRINITY_DN42894_c0_g1~~TRINITY_DN42894_c0_g1_i1.p1  ORF type:complete len:284 (-),score=37.94 TRINITY_DN42894_c0_g1_i1:10-783(-)